MGGRCGRREFARVITRDGARPHGICVAYVCITAAHSSRARASFRSCCARSSLDGPSDSKGRARARNTGTPLARTCLCFQARPIFSSCCLSLSVLRTLAVCCRPVHAMTRAPAVAYMVSFTFSTCSSAAFHLSCSWRSRSSASRMRLASASSRAFCARAACSSALRRCSASSFRFASSRRFRFASTAASACKARSASLAANSCARRCPSRSRSWCALSCRSEGEPMGDGGSCLLEGDALGEGGICSLGAQIGVLSRGLCRVRPANAALQGRQPAPT